MRLKNAIKRESFGLTWWVAFGLRHLIYSVVAMPETASPSLDVTISEMEPPHLYRTFLSLLILCKSADINKDPYEVADLVTHVWYSYKWPRHLVDFFEKYLAAEFQVLADGINRFISLGTHDRWFRYSWSSDTLALDAGFRWSNWSAIRSYVMEFIHQEPIHRDIHILRENDVGAYGEPLDRAFARMSPSRVAGLVKWRQTGLMLAYGDSTLPHAYFNPQVKS